MEHRTFPDGETYLRYKSDLEGRDVLVVTDWHRPNRHFLPVIYAAKTARELGASSVGVVAPYLPYMRQDSRFRPGEAVTSRYFSEMISAEFDWLVTAEPHLHRYGTLDGLYKIPTRAVRATEAIGRWIVEHVDAPLLVGPDEESEQWVSAAADVGDLPTLVLEKVRRGDYDVAIEGVIQGQQRQGRQPVLIDDIISTGRTMVEAVRWISDAGLAKPICVGIHGLFADGARDKLDAVGVKQVVTCNTVPHPTNAIDISEELVAGVGALLSNEELLSSPLEESGVSPS